MQQENFAAACEPKHVRSRSAHERPTSLAAALTDAVQYRRHQCALQLEDGSGSARHRRRRTKPESEQLALPAIPTAAEKPAATDAPSATSTGEDGDRSTA